MREIVYGWNRLSSLDSVTWRKHWEKNKQKERRNELRPLTEQLQVTMHDMCDG